MLISFMLIHSSEVSLEVTQFDRWDKDVITKPNEMQAKPAQTVSAAGYVRRLQELARIKVT